MRMLRRLTGARRPDDATDATLPAPFPVTGVDLAGRLDDVDHLDDDVTGHLRPPRAATAPPITEPIPSELLAPIAGVSVDQYVAVSARLAAHHYDPSCVPTITSEAGIDTAAWDVAAAGFNARVSASATFARHFNALYRAAQDRAS